jgi:hypothetical protein
MIIPNCLAAEELKNDSLTLPEFDKRGEGVEDVPYEM